MEHAIGTRIEITTGKLAGHTGLLDSIAAGWATIELDYPPVGDKSIKEGMAKVRPATLQAVADQHLAPLADKEEDADEAPVALTPAQLMARTLRNARVRYTKARRPSGTQSAHCGDAIAKELRDLEPQEVAELADKVTNQPAGTHMLKYGHLNNGQIRMNSGNRIRTAWKAAEEGGDPTEIERLAAMLGLELGIELGVDEDDSEE